MSGRYKLYHYWRSSSSWRVRMALAFKGVAVEPVAVDLLSGAQRLPDHLARNPSGLVPCLEIAAGVLLAQSAAIIEWLEETHPAPPLLSRDPLERARVRELVQIVNADTQPVQNLRVMQYHSQDQGERAAWARHWIETGLSAYEARVKLWGRGFSFGDAVTMADLFLVPQVYNAARFNVDLDALPLCRDIYAKVLKLPFCQNTAPDKFQP